VPLTASNYDFIFQLKQTILPFHAGWPSTPRRP